MRGNTIATAAAVTIIAGLATANIWNTDIGPRDSKATQTPERLECATPTATENPCAKISASWAEHKKQNKTVRLTVAASLAHECLKTVPLGKQEAIQLIDAIEPYLEWQSDAAYKKDPPESYFYPGFDIFGNLAKVRSNVQADKYAGEFDFQTDLYKQVWAPGHDSHYSFQPDLLFKAFFWGRNTPIVSISEDGEALPVIKLQADVLANPETAPVITKINGIDAAKYIEDSANAASNLHDPDASYNAMFWSKATAADGRYGAFITADYSFLFYPGDTTNMTFANGTTVETENEAYISGDLTGVVDGPSMYKKFCTPVSLQPAAAPATANATMNSTIKETIVGYPKPVIVSSDGVVSGYYLSGPNLDDVAVICLRSFETKRRAEFQTVVSDFLREAKAAGKTKLVVDLQQNNGGFVLLAYDFFRQLFPSIVQDGISRWKLSKSHTYLARVISDIVKDVNPATEANRQLLHFYTSPWNYRFDLNITNQHFATFDDKFHPHVYKDTHYSNLIRTDSSDPLTTSNTTWGIGIEVSGYGARTNLAQPFQAENIILLYDGACDSSCATVSELLRLQGGVKSIVMGGRSKKGPMQGVGGIKGAEMMTFDRIYNWTNTVSQLTNDSEIKAELQRFSVLPMQRSKFSQVNARDQILRDNVDDGVPAQYVVEEADCRLYWTAPMIADITEVWKSAANSGFNGAKCAHSGIF
ncbi:hypothetical protein ACQRIT_007451 [Beauveria bassiana]